MTGQELLVRWMAFYRKYVLMSEQQALAVALWAINTWVYDHFPAVPFLEIVASTKRSGKTTLLTCLKKTCRGAEQFAIVRILTILRMIEAFEGKITVLVDEAEQFSKPSLGEQRSGIATGYLAGSQHAISTGKTFTRFRTFAPWAFAQIGNVHGVLRDRCIEIELERGKPERILAEWDANATAEGQELISELVAYARTKTKDGRLYIPVVACEWLSGRERQIWTPLYSVASWLGLNVETMRALQQATVDLGEMKKQPAKVWHSAQDEVDAENRDAAERVLRDLQSVFKDGELWLISADAVERLRGIPTAPWRAWQVKGLSTISLSALLDRYGISTVDQRVGKGRKDSRVLKVYRAAEVMRVKP